MPKRKNSFSELTRFKRRTDSIRTKKTQTRTLETKDVPEEEWPEEWTDTGTVD